jgi:hypothetical protein
VLGPGKAVRRRLIGVSEPCFCQYQAAEERRS